MCGMKTIFLFIPQQVFATDLLQSHYLEYLAAKYRVVVFSPFIDDSIMQNQQYFKNQNTVYIQWANPNQNLLNWFKYRRVNFINEFNKLIITRQPAGEKTQAKSRKNRLIKFLLRPFSKIINTGFFTKIEGLLIKRPKEFDNWIREYQPSLVITPTPGLNAYDANAILLAKKYKIPTLATNFTWDNLTSESHIIRKSDYLFIWNEIVRKEAVNIHHYPDNRIFTTGIMRFDHYFQNEPNPKTRESFLASKNLNPKLPMILYSTVSTSFIYHRKHLQYLLDLREEKLIPYTSILIRVHPLDPYNDYLQFADLPDVCVEKAGRDIPWPEGGTRIGMTKEDFLNLKYTIKYCDLNINFVSTISLEAAIFDKPVINYIEPGKEYMFSVSHYKPIAESGAIKLVKNIDEYRDAIIAYLKNPKLDQEKRRKLIDSYVPFQDGLAYKRAVDYIEKII